MKKIAILVPKGEVMPNAVMGAYFLLTQANVFLRSQGIDEVFDVKICGYQSQVQLYDGSFSAQTLQFEKTEIVFDLLLIPGFTCEMDGPIQMNSELIEWMKQQHLEHGTELASMCTGAFLLASTGLLNGKKCTSHWAFETSFRKKFPEVNFQPEHIVTDDKGCYSSGGAYSSLNLILYLIEKFCNKETATWISKVFQLDMDRTSQVPFMIFNQQKSHLDDAIGSVQSYIEKHFTEALTVAQLATKFAFSHRNFIRRFKEATGNTPFEYIQRVRVEAAKRYLESSNLSVQEVIYKSGYSDGKAFRSIFKKFTGYAPREYRLRYGKN